MERTVKSHVQAATREVVIDEQLLIGGAGEGMKRDDVGVAHLGNGLDGGFKLFLLLLTSRT